MASFIHPYYPLGVEIPNYQPNEWSGGTLLSVFFIASTVVLTVATNVAFKLNPRISTVNLLKALWFTLCSPIHLVIEGYYALNFLTLQSSQSYLAQLWKEYSLSDSRYLTSNGFVQVMESVTAWAWGPLSLLQAYLIATESPFQHPLQIIISTGQLYGDVLYFGISFFDLEIYGIEYSRPEPYYYYLYFVLANAFWIVIPGLLIVDSVVACGKAFAEVKRMRDTKKRS